jgi:PEP-CTERM motif
MKTSRLFLVVVGAIALSSASLGQNSVTITGPTQLGVWPEGGLTFSASFTITNNTGTDFPSVGLANSSGILRDGDDTLTIHYPMPATFELLPYGKVVVTQEFTTGPDDLDGNKANFSSVLQATIAGTGPFISPPFSTAIVTTDTPEPSTFLLLGSGVFGLMGLLRRKLML